MASIPRPSLFSWKNVAAKSDLDRLQLVLDALPDEELMQKLERQRGRGRDYYLRPFASRYDRARAAWGSYLFYRDEDHSELIRASERGGGPILYITDQDLDGNGLSDYRLFDTDGCGDQGVGLPIVLTVECGDENCLGGYCPQIF